MSLDLRGLGTVEAWCDGRKLALGGAKQLGLLALLMLEPNRVVPLERLLDRLWPAGETDRTTLYRLASRLRRVLADSGHDVLVSRSGGYQLAVDPDRVDIHRFERLVREGRHALASGDVEPGARLLAEALALWRGSALTGAPDSVRNGATSRLDELRLLAVEERAGAELELGRYEPLLPELRELVAEYPWRERLTGHLMTALHRSGRRAEALEVYAGIRQRMVDELGLEPGPELRRLQQRLLADDRPYEGRQPAAAAPAPTPRQLPVDVRAFTGRAELLGRLDELVNAGTTAIVAITGMAGVGKTTLAVHWAHAAAARFPDGQLYVDLRGFDASEQIVSPEQAVRGFLDAFAVPPDRVPADPDAQFALFRSVLSGKDVLVVLDNARDAAHVRPLLAGSPGSLTVVTSRDQLAGLIAAEGAQVVGLEPLDLDEGRLLLTGRLGATRTAAEPQAVDDITNLCGGLPLALAMVAARAATHPGHELEALAAELDGAQGRLDLLTDGGPGVRAAFSWSYGQLDAEAARLFRLLGLHFGPDVSLRASASLAGIAPREAQRMLAQLCRANLVSEHAPGRYRLHDLLHTYAYELATECDTEAQRHDALHRAFDHYLHTAYAGALLLAPRMEPIPVAKPQPEVRCESLENEDQALAWFAAERSVLLATIAGAGCKGLGSHAWQLTAAFAAYLWSKGPPHELTESWRTALNAAQSAGDKLGEARARRGLAFGCARSGQLDEAHLQAHQSLALYVELGDLDGQGITHRTIGDIYRRQENYKDALTHLQRALDLHRATGNVCYEANALNGVGWYRAMLGDYEQAVLDCERAVGLLRQIGDGGAEGAAWDSLGYAHQHLGHLEQAEACYRRALGLSRDAQAPYLEAEALAHLGDLQQANGDTTAAVDSWAEAERIRSKLQQL